MLTDDEESILELVAATLGDLDRYDLLLANSGEQALEIARREKPDLLFLDILMPNINGYEVCKRLKSDPATAHIRIVMLTALAQESDRKRAMDVGADDYFTKPFSPIALLDKVEEMLSAG